MSHFSVMVVGENVEEQLSKYDENMQVEPYPAYTLESATKQLKKSIEEFTNALETNDKNCNLAYCKDRLEELSKQTPEEYFKSICEEYDAFDKDGNPTTTYNPDSKWDWYSLGGRWSDFLILKDGSKSDSALKKDIDVEKMMSEAVKGAEENWKNAKDKHTDWADIIYWNYGISKEDWLNNGKEKHIENVKRNVLKTFALVKDGVWYEKGKMGWWACVSNEKMDWSEQFQKLFDSINDDELISIIDCHI